MIVKPQPVQDFGIVHITQTSDDSQFHGRWLSVSLKLFMTLFLIWVLSNMENVCLVPLLYIVDRVCTSTHKTSAIENTPTMCAMDYDLLKSRIRFPYEPLGHSPQPTLKETEARATKSKRSGLAHPLSLNNTVTLLRQCAAGFIHHWVGSMIKRLSPNPQHGASRDASVDLSNCKSYYTLWC